MRFGKRRPEENTEADLRRELAAVHERLDRISASLDQLAAARKHEAKWKRNFRIQLASLVRAQYLGSGLAGSNALEARRFRLRSQNEEDGIVLALLQATGVSGRRFVEIGSGGTGGNSAVLAYELGWSGLMVDASGSAVKTARALFAAKPGVVIERETVTPDNIDRVVTEYGFAGEVDVLSIDVDSIDYWLLDALTAVRARVLVMEYNALFGPERAVTVPNTPRPEGVPKGYYGASLAALAKCACRQGYRLVLCEEAGVNAFFVRDDLARDIPTLKPAQAWRPMSDRYDVTGTTAASETDIYKIIAEKGLSLVDV
jgi:hypothetical protein